MNLEKVLHEIKNYDGNKLRIMEVCGTHTSSIFKNGIRSMLSPAIHLISGPGCPVCVTPSSYIDKAIEWSHQPDSILLTFGDMVKVPGRNQSLGDARADGAKVEIIYSPQEALKKATDNPGNTYVLASVGFETTIPAYSLLIEQMEKDNITNIKLLTALRRVLPALDFICSTDQTIDAYIAPGHVSTILGAQAYTDLARRYEKPFVVAGFEAEHVLIAIYDLIKQVSNQRHDVHNLYPSMVKPEGNKAAMAYIDKYFEPGAAHWRGLGTMDESGYYLRQEYQKYDAGSLSLLTETDEQVLTACRCGEVVTGRINPNECQLFGKACTPLKAKGPCMVSAEGTCGIWYRFADR